MGTFNIFGQKKKENPKSEILKNYYEQLAVDRMKIRYLELRSKITMLALDSCIEDYDKEGLNEKEILCIKEKTNTFLNYFKEFNVNQKENFDSFINSNNKYNI